MPPKKEQLLDLPSKMEDQMLYSDAVKALVQQKKDELDNLNHKIELAKINLRQTEDSCVRERSEFNSKLSQEKGKFESERQNKLNEFNLREDKLRTGEKSYNERLISLQDRELANQKIEQERKQIFSDRIAAENMKSEATIQLNKTLAIQSEMGAKLSQAANLEVTSREKINQATNIMDEANRRLDKAEALLKDVNNQKENLERIREYIKPQLEEIEKSKKENLDILAEVKSREQSIVSKIEENKKIGQNISVRMETLKKKEIELSTLEEEVRRRGLLNETK